MSITVDLPQEVLSDLREITNRDTDISAIEFAISEYLRRERLCEFSDQSDKVEMTEDWKYFNEVVIASGSDDS